ncbi:tetratricopeptide repeat protein, partial [bacterium]|nr:tetratricopeptide repeat protein [bacterium]
MRSRNFRIVLLFLCLILPFCIVMPQTIPIDSQLIIVGNMEDNAEKLKEMKGLMRLFLNVDIVQAQNIGLEGVSLAQELKLNSYEADFYNNLGILYREQGIYDQALDFLFESLKIKEKLGDKGKISKTINNIGMIQSDMGDYEKALINLHRSLDIAIELGDSIRISRYYNNIGFTYSESGNYELAKEYLIKSINLGSIVNDSVTILNAFWSLGTNYTKEQNFELAEENFNKSLGYCLSAGDIFTSIKVNIDLGKLYNQTNRYIKAISCLKLALETAHEINSPDLIRDASEVISYSYEHIHNYEKAHSFYKAYDSINTSLQVEEQRANIAVAVAVNEFEKERAVTSQIIKRKKLVNMFLYIATGLGLLLTFFIYRNYRIKKKANLLLAEMDQLKSKLFSNISHEFRTPLTLILGPLEEMMEMEKEKKPRRKTVKMMRRNANRLLNLVNQMLDLSKLDAGSMKLELVEGDLIKSLKVIV